MNLELFKLKTLKFKDLKQVKLIFITKARDIAAKI